MIDDNDEKYLLLIWQVFCLKGDMTVVKDVDDQVSSLRDNIAYIQDNINECQSNIMQMEEGKVCNIFWCVNCVCVDC